MKVQTDFEIKHFITYVNVNLVPVKMNVLDHKDKFFITKVNGEDFEIHEDVLTCLQTNCPSMKVEYKMLQ